MAREFNFLSRWSRRKLQSERKAAAAKSAPAAAPAPAKTDRPPEPPPLDQLGFESDFKAFMQAKVDETVRRAALKKLFSDPRFNVMDGLDVYIDDYTKNEPVSRELLARLDHAKSTLFGPEPKPEEAAREKGAEPSSASAPEGSGREQIPQTAEPGPDSEEQEKDGAAGQDSKAV
jgi:hypothetical protein